MKNKKYNRRIDPDQKSYLGFEKYEIILGAWSAVLLYLLTVLVFCFGK